MSQRASGWERKANDLYETPSWVTQALIPHLPWTGGVCWEPAAGSGKMAAVLDNHFTVVSTDQDRGEPFLGFGCAAEATSIITNPPYNQAQEFIEHALKLLEPSKGMAAFLLRVDFDSAKTRAHLFADNPAWFKKVVLLKRIVWFKGEKSPSFNHAWYLFNHRHEGPATIAYSPLESL